APEEGLDHQVPMPEVPAADDLPDFKTRMAPHKHLLGDWYERPRPIDIRYVEGDPMSRSRTPTVSQRVWLRADGTLPDDPVLHACIVTYASDMTLLDTTVLPHGLNWTDSGLQMASLDHAMWFHRAFRADDWLLYDQMTPTTSHARGLATGSIFSRSGDLVITVVQEGLIRRERT
ncbi:MAG: acyl-CoA thioesterase, partial [Actinomycetota bacterium]